VTIIVVKAIVIITIFIENENGIPFQDCTSIHNESLMKAQKKLKE